MNPYGQFFGVPQPYYGAIPPTYQPFLSTGLVGYTPITTTPTTVTVSQPLTQPTTEAAPVTQVIVQQEKTPVTTVFVGNIPERAPDSLIKSLLMVVFVLNLYINLFSDVEISLVGSGCKELQENYKHSDFVSIKTPNPQ